jgi:hypothetical protein
MDGINYLYIKKNGLYFVFTTRDNVSPSLGLELLTRLTKLFKDYTGVSRMRSIQFTTGKQWKRRGKPVGDKSSDCSPPSLFCVSVAPSLRF